jgi:hypothetical protein
MPKLIFIDYLTPTQIGDTPQCLKNSPPTVISATVIICALIAMNDRELMEGLKRSKKDVEEGRVYELKNVDELDENWKFDNFTQVRT